jgi:acyl carrier protein
VDDRAVAGIEDRIKEILVHRVGLHGPPSSIDASSSLIDGLGVDSQGILNLVTALEEEFDIEIDDEEVVPDLFESITSVARLIQSKT